MDQLLSTIGPKHRDGSSIAEAKLHAVQEGRNKLRNIKGEINNTVYSRDATDEKDDDVRVRHGKGKQKWLRVRRTTRNSFYTPLSLNSCYKRGCDVGVIRTYKCKTPARG